MPGVTAIVCRSESCVHKKSIWLAKSEAMRWKTAGRSENAVHLLGATANLQWCNFVKPSLLGCPVQVETPIAIVDRNLDRLPLATRQKTRACAEAFVQYLFKPEAQKEFSACGFRQAILCRLRCTPNFVAASTGRPQTCRNGTGKAFKGSCMSHQQAVLKCPAGTWAQ